MILVGRVTSPFFAGRMQFDEDCYLSKLTKGLQVDLGHMIGWDVDAVRDECRRLCAELETKWINEERIQEGRPAVATV